MTAPPLRTRFRNGVTEADFTAHLDWAQGTGANGWTRADDLALVLALVHDSMAEAVRVFSRPADDLRRRWDRLYPPDLRGIDEQAFLLVQLRRRAQGRDDGART